MTNPPELLHLALDLGGGTNMDKDEAAARRSISTAYYALFHQLIQAAVKVFQPAGTATQVQAARAFNHRAMRDVCTKFSRWSERRRIEKPFDALVSATPDSRLTNVADCFVKLHEARARADYDISSDFTAEDVAEGLRLLVSAWEDFENIEACPDTQVFLVGLLLAERWTRRG